MTSRNNLQNTHDIATEERMRHHVNFAYISRMAASLDNTELGAALRILSSILTNHKPIPLQRLHIVSGMHHDCWMASKDAILEFFIVADEQVHHAALEDMSRPHASDVPQTDNRSGTGELGLVWPTRSQQVPCYPDRDEPERISIKKTAYDIIVRLFESSGQSENTARAALASLLKNWPEGDVYEALSAASRQTHVVDPRSWIVSHLKNNSTPIARKSFAHASGKSVPAPRGRRQITSPEAVGVSAGTAETIRKKNRELNFNINSMKGADA